MALLDALQEIALRLPQAEVGVACAGTAQEKRTVKARGKAFLFLGPADAMLKLGPSLPEASERAAREPGRYKVGAHGWVTVTTDGEAPLDLLERWIEESYRVVVRPPSRG